MFTFYFITSIVCSLVAANESTNASTEGQTAVTFIAFVAYMAFAMLMWVVLWKPLFSGFQ